MQIFVPAVNAIFVPIPKNASRALTTAITRRWPDHMVVGQDFKGERVVMWRDPRDRIESTYRFMRDQGMDEPFAKWVMAVCKEGLRDPHLQPQVKFCSNPAEIFKWDFDAFRKYFRIKRPIEPEGASNNYPCCGDWDERAEYYFREAYRVDIRIWEGYKAYGS